MEPHAGQPRRHRDILRGLVSGQAARRLLVLRAPRREAEGLGTLRVADTRRRRGIRGPVSSRAPFGWVHLLPSLAFLNGCVLCAPPARWSGSLRRCDLRRRGAKCESVHDTDASAATADRLANCNSRRWHRQPLLRCRVRSWRASREGPLRLMPRTASGRKLPLVPHPSSGDLDRSGVPARSTGPTTDAPWPAEWAPKP